MIYLAPYACPYEYEDDIRVCWKATTNGTMASSIIEYDHGQNNFYDGVRYGIENCLFEFFFLRFYNNIIHCYRYFRTFLSK